LILLASSSLLRRCTGSNGADWSCTEAYRRVLGQAAIPGPVSTYDVLNVPEPLAAARPAWRAKAIQIVAPATGSRFGALLE
jgi:hypothetical protein